MFKNLAQAFRNKKSSHCTWLRLLYTHCCMQGVAQGLPSPELLLEECGDKQQIVLCWEEYGNSLSWYQNQNFEAYLACLWPSRGTKDNKRKNYHRIYVASVLFVSIVMSDPGLTLVRVVLSTQNQTRCLVRDFDFVCFLYLMKHRNIKVHGGVEMSLYSFLTSELHSAEWLALYSSRQHNPRWNFFSYLLTYLLHGAETFLRS
jgi:hypothetical protein